MVWYFLKQEEKLVCAVNSDDGILRPEEWVSKDIDEYPYADNGVLLYKLEENDVIRKTDEEVDEEYSELVTPTVEEQLADLSDYVDVLTEMILGGAE